MRFDCRVRLLAVLIWALGVSAVAHAQIEVTSATREVKPGLAPYGLGGRPIVERGVGIDVDDAESDETEEQDVDGEEPSVLRDPRDEDKQLVDPEALTDLRRPFFRVPNQSPRGFAGESPLLPREVQTTSQFEPVEDRWRLGLPYYDRYGNGHPEQTDAIGVEGNWWDPYNQNLLKGDYPFAGQDIFLRMTLRSTSLFEGRQLPITTNGVTPTRDRNVARALGDPDSFQSQHNETVSFDLFQGSTTFRPPDWRVRLDAVFNMNHFVGDVPGSATSSPNSGQSRFREDFTLQEWFFEKRLLDTSSNFDFMSTRVGSQTFISDFKGFIFADTNRGLRLFGTRHANQDQYNLVWFDQMEKDTNSFLNRIEKDRHQNTFIANYYRQDWVFPGPQRQCVVACQSRSRQSRKRSQWLSSSAGHSRRSSATSS